MTHSTLQMQWLAAGGEGGGGERLELRLPLVQLGQQAVLVDLNPGLLQGRHHRLLHLRVAEAGGGGRSGEGHVDARTLDAQPLQSLHSGEDVQAVAIDDGVICTDRAGGVLTSDLSNPNLMRYRKSKITFEFFMFQTEEMSK